MARQTGTRIRGLVIISTIAVALVLLLASAVQAFGSAAPAPTSEVTSVEYRVEPGDTLWVIAGEHGSGDRDLRDVVEAIRRLNDLDGSIIHPGQILEVPVG